MTETRLRRSSAEVRGLMLDAARRLFHAKGFDATSTREISHEAGVSESMLFRHFGSKQAVYDAAVLDPFVRFVQTFVDDWTRAPSAAQEPERLALDYVTGFHELCREHRDLIALLSAEPDDRSGSAPGATARALIRAQLDALVTQLGRHHAGAGSEPGMDPRLAVRFAIAIVVGAAQLGDEFFDVGDRLATELAAFVVRGAGHDDGREPHG